MCVADAADGWAELLRAARRTYPSEIMAWVLARHARYLYLASRPELAIQRWEEAVERATERLLYDDAADWLYSIRAARIESDSDLGDLDGGHRLAQALRASGRGTVLPEPYPARERVLSSLRDEKWPDAFESLSLYLWRSVVIADWVGEVEAHRRFGQLFAATGRAPLAVQHFVRGGKSAEVTELAKALPDTHVAMPTDVLSDAPWERVTAYAFAESASDLLADDDAAAWAASSADEMLRHPRSVRSMLASNPTLAAFKAFGELSELSNKDDAAAFVAESKKLIPRDPNTYRHTDEAQVAALAGIARAHPELRREATEQLCDALLVDAHMADLVLSQAADLLRSEPSLVEERLAERARAGHFHAALALTFAEAGLESIVPVAQEQLEKAIAQREHTAGTFAIGTGLQMVGPLVTALPESEREAFARAMLRVAADELEPMPNRQEALLAVLPVGKRMSAAASELFETALCFARGEHDRSAVDIGFPGSADPLSRFRLNFGPSTLRPDGLMLAAQLARTPDETRRVQEVATDLLAGADERTANQVARALSAVPPGELDLDIDFLGSHPSASIRALAAVLWAQRSETEEKLGERLARDPSPLVRRSLASSLRDEAAHSAARDVLTRDPRRSVRRAVGTADS
jgi:hypothetical protein